MQTLSRVGVDAVDYADAPHAPAETPVSLRPSREFSAHYEDEEITLVVRRASRAKWLGLVLFSSVMLGIVGAAALVAVDEQVALMQRDQNVPRPGIGAMLEAKAQELGWISAEPAAPRPPEQAKVAALAAVVAEPLAEKPEAVAQAQRPEAAPQADVLAPREADVRSSEHLPEPAVSEQPQKRSEAADRLVKLAKRERANKAAARAAAKSEEKVASGSWESERNAARDAYSAGRYGDAVRLYERAVAANPHHALTLAGLGAARMQTGDVGGAAEAYRRAVRIAPDNLTLQVGLARAYAATGDTARARSTYQRVLALDPGNVAAQSALARL